MERHSVRPSTGLTRRQLFGVLGVALAIFAVGAGPVWRDPWNIDSSILLSYVVLPPMVLAVLLVSRRFTWRDFALDTLTLTCTKFGVTYIAAAAIWAVSGEPPPLERSPPPDFPRARVAVPPAVAPSDAATVEGIVAAAGAPRAGAVVWVERGAEGHAYPTRSDVIELVHDGRGFVPAVAALQAGEPLRLRSASGQMHAVRGMGEDGRSVFNLAVTQVSTLVRLNNAAGVVTLTCAVQAHAGKEQPGRLVLLAHPFFVTTVADGRFRFEGLPRGEIVLRALDAELGEARQTVELPSRRSVTLTFTAARSP